jgi:hypothetical protein
MEDSINRFYKRQNALVKKHERMARGYVTRLNKNGTFEQVPDSKAGGVGLRLILLTALLFMGFKAMVYVGLGTDSYMEHVDALNQGSRYEKVGAWFMQVDPVTAKLGEFASRIRS